MKEKLHAILEAIETCPTNIWAVLLIVTGSLLVLCHHDDPGKAIVGGGLTAFQFKR
jgi:membrane-bound ClpP family serine protease